MPRPRYWHWRASLAKSTAMTHCHAHPVLRCCHTFPQFRREIQKTGNRYEAVMEGLRLSDWKAYFIPLPTHFFCKKKIIIPQIGCVMHNPNCDSPDHLALRCAQAWRVKTQVEWETVQVESTGLVDENKVSQSVTVTVKASRITQENRWKQVRISSNSNFVIEAWLWSPNRASILAIEGKKVGQSSMDILWTTPIT